MYSDNMPSRSEACQRAKSQRYIDFRDFEKLVLDLKMKTKTNKKQKIENVGKIR